MSDTIEYIVTAKNGLDVSSFDKDGKRRPARAECGSKLKLTREQAASIRFVNLVKPADAKSLAKSDADKLKAEKEAKAKARSDAAKKGAETKKGCC